MNPQERAVIDGIFERLRAVAGQPRDPQAEAYIAENIKAQPYAPYALAQSVYVQEQAMLNQQQQIEQLQAQVAELEQQVQQAQQQAAPQQGGFLSGIFGGGNAAAQPQREPPAYGQRGREAQGGAGGPWGGASRQQIPAQQDGVPQQRPGMGFLGTAAAAAAGVAGGMMLGNVLSSAFGGGGAHAAQNNAGNFGNLGLENNKGQQQGQDAQSGYEDEEENDDEGYDDAGDYGDDDGGDTYEA